MAETGPREAVYDAEIAPLMAQIIKICLKHQIPLVGHFELDPEPSPEDPLYCTTFIGEDWAYNTKRHKLIGDAVIDGKSPAPSMMAITITKGGES